MDGLIAQYNTFKCYTHGPSARYSSNFIVISKEPFCLGNGLRRFKKIEPIYTKLGLSVMQILLNNWKFMVLIRYFMRQSVKDAANSG